MEQSGILQSALKLWDRPVEGEEGRCWQSQFVVFVSSMCMCIVSGVMVSVHYFACWSTLEAILFSQSFHLFLDQRYRVSPANCTKLSVSAGMWYGRLYFLLIQGEHLPVNSGTCWSISKNQHMLLWYHNYSQNKFWSIDLYLDFCLLSSACTTLSGELQDYVDLQDAALLEVCGME